MEVKHNIQLRDVIQDRIALTGVSQAKLSETICTTPAQLSLYLRGKASLNNEALESLISALDINVASYNKRFQLAKDIAHFFNVEKIPMNVVLKMKHEDMILTTGKAELKYLVDVNAEEFKYIVASGIIDFEGTYPFFRVMVAQLMNVGEKPTAKTITESILEVAKKIPSINQLFKVIPFVGAYAGTSMYVTGKLAESAINIFGKQVGFLAPLLSLTLHSLEEYENY